MRIWHFFMPAHEGYGVLSIAFFFRGGTQALRTGTHPCSFSRLLGGHQSHYAVQSPCYSDGSIKSWKIGLKWVQVCDRAGQMGSLIKMFSWRVPIPPLNKYYHSLPQVVVYLLIHRDIILSAHFMICSSLWKNNIKKISSRCTDQILMLTHILGL